ncbi:hypothetical protein [Enterobacter kobei]|uniref:hypothetical protein n=1 Tax=Enterobacter kobei TaxID=208224 RepID=UPI001FD407F8|nr:hypothetical protein [Enterobacter kobei]
MSTITKEFTKEQLIEQAKKNIEVLRNAVEKIPGSSDAAVIHLKLAEIALASLEAEPVGTFRKGPCGYSPSFHEDAVPLFTAPPAPISVPAAMEMDDDFDSSFEHGKAVGWNAYRAAMLQGAEPVSQPYTLPEVIDENLVEGLRLLQCMLDDYRERNYGHAHEWIRHIDRKFAEHSESHEDDAYSIFSSLLQGVENAETPTTMQTAPALDSSPKIAELPSGNSPVIPDGYALVPVEPTEHMIVEGFESEPDEFFSDEEVWEAYDAMSGCQQAAHRAKLCWAAMIASAPKPEA